MYTRFQTTSKGVNAYIQKSVRIDGRSKTITVMCLGLLSEIQKREGCADPREWVEELAARLTREEKEASQKIRVELSPKKQVKSGTNPLRMCGDLMLLGLYNRLGLPELCRRIQDGCRAKFDIPEIMRTLVLGRILYPASKRATRMKALSMVKAPEFDEHTMYRALSKLAGHADDIQAAVYRNSLNVMPRRDKVIFYDCTNYYFEIEEGDKEYVDRKTGEVIEGLRQYGKSKEHRPNPIVQMGMFMDYDGIPLAYRLFPGNQSEQQSLQPLEEVLQSKFLMNQFVVSTDAGLASEDNRMYNMEGEREYICVQSIPSLRKADREACISPKGWRVAFRRNADKRLPLDPSDPGREIFDLDQLREAARTNPGMLRDTTLYKEILVSKDLRQDNKIVSRRTERVIVTYSHDFALYQKAKRAEQVSRAKKIVDRKQQRSRQSQQDPRHYVTTLHRTRSGEKAVKVEMRIDTDVILNEEILDGFYAYGTSLDDEAVDVLRIRSFHHEIEHLFRTTKTFLDARPVFVSRQDRIRAHFLICFLAMVILKMLQRRIIEANPDYYKDHTLTIDNLIATLRTLNVGHIPGRGYLPMFDPTDLVHQLQDLAGVNITTEIIPTRTMNDAYRKVKNT